MTSKHLAGLNAEQLASAQCMDDCLVIAAPGSGKTKMLASKASNLLSLGATVTAVTFTRDSALELRARIVSQAGEAVLPSLLVGTFHSIDLLMAFPGSQKSIMGREILRHSRSSLKKPWKIVTEGARRDAVMRAIDESKIGPLDLIEATAMIEAIKSGHKKQCSPEELALVDAYTGILDRQGVIDFQDILLKTNAGISSGDISVLKTDFLLLDEFQDTDLTQYEWAIAHAKSGTKLTAVGDDDQSIYGFRRAMGFRGMVNFEAELGAKKFILGLNYRSHAEVLRHADKLIELNRDVRMPKSLVAHKGPGGQAFWERFDGAKEADACISQVEAALRENQTVGILARTNRRLDKIEKGLIKAKIPYSRAGGDSILNTREAELVLSALSAIATNNANDADRLLSWCGVDEEDLQALHRKLGKSIFDAIMGSGRSALSSVAVKDGTKKTLTMFAKQLGPWKEHLDLDDDGVGSVFIAARACELLLQHATDNRSKGLIELLCDIFKRKSPGGIKQLVDEIRKRMSTPKNESEVTTQVTLMTAHASKGLEFDMVWILGADTDTFPAKEAQIGSAMQEERRLFYVAMTRAKKTLWISATSAEVSSFILESDVPRVGRDYFSDIHRS